ncbi:PspA/IM30 family protein [Glycomyces buryatensis]|uniref:PspA/IM30 family protein n=1 Tax=Glycomyces buryatensis TaxID=2570927 RepID=A0A4S8QID2_9ACTN|nr:PspA/IM30 family protein [Glycomyces buryatensis]THV43511.1 PspA/IM30 family protein [Glycomyces buryatensis]
MANPFVKGWKYMMALFGAKIDEHADPKIQIQQAIEEAQKSHQTLVGQAASVIGNQRQLEMKLNRSMAEVERLQAQARQALVLSDKARADGDEAKAQQFEQTAEVLASQLVSTEQSLEDMKTMHDQAINAAEQAKKAVENNQMMLQQKLQERTKLLGQLEQAKMQETIASSLESMSQTAAPGNVPNFGEIRDKIEGRYSNAMGRAELASNSVEGRLLEVNRATRDMAGASRLDQIRASLEGDQLSGSKGGAPAVQSKETVTNDRLADIRASLNEGPAEDTPEAEADTTKS